jgi:hypothetical protein
LPDDEPMRVIVLERPLTEILLSQARLAAERGVATHDEDPATIEFVLRQHLDEFRKWLASRPVTQWIVLDYRRAIAEPADAARSVAEFTGRPLHESAMAAAVDASLYRERADRAVG